MKILFGLIAFSVAAFAQTNSFNLKGGTLIEGVPYEIYEDQDQNQIYKKRTEKSENAEERPTPANEYGRLGVFNTNIGFGWQNYSNENWSYTKDGQRGLVGDLEGGRETIKSLTYGLAIDLGGNIRIPLKVLNRLETGIQTSIMITECHKGHDSPIENPDKTAKQTVISIPKYAFSTQCPKKFTDIFTRNWSAHSLYDVLILKSSRSNYVFSAGGFVQGLGADHYVGEEYLGYQRNYEKGAVVRFSKLGSGSGSPYLERLAGMSWAVTAYVGGKGNVRIMIGTSFPIISSRINKPTKVEK